MLSLLRIRGAEGFRIAATPRILAPLALLALLTATGCKPGATLTYEVHGSKTLPRDLLVDLRLEGLPPGEAIVLRSYASPADSRIVDLRAFDARGESLSVVATPETAKSSTRYSVMPPSSGTLSVRYRIVLAGRPGNANTGFELRRKLVVDERFAFLRGRDLFLFADRPEGVGGAKVSFSLPAGWRAWATWIPEAVIE